MTSHDVQTTNNWGRWGDDDERGALNLLTPEVVRAAAASITTGVVYSLGIPIQDAGVPIFPYRGAPRRLTMRDSTDAGSYPPMPHDEGTGSHEDVLVIPSHSQTHIDALVHVYTEYHHYNGVGHDTMRAMGGAQKLGIDKVGAFAARAVLLDMVAHLGEETHVEHGRPITAADLQGAADAAGVEVRPGDVVLVRTGYIQDWWRRHERGEPEPRTMAGVDGSAARWLAGKDVVAVGSDNAAVEVIPFHDGEMLHGHKVLLRDHGIYLIELLDLLAPANDGVAEGLLAVGPLKIPGATGSPVNPILIG